MLSIQAPAIEDTGDKPVWNEGRKNGRNKQLMFFFLYPTANTRQVLKLKANGRGQQKEVGGEGEGRSRGYRGLLSSRFSVAVGPFFTIN